MSNAHNNDLAASCPSSLLASLRTFRPALWVRWLLTSAIALVGWIICETLGGLLFLTLGVRLWAYHITPVVWQLTSLVAWVLVFGLVGTTSTLYLLWEQRRQVTGLRRWCYRGLFLMIAGPFFEVVFNSAIWTLAKTPLYLYTVWPTFGGSGSYLSPLYYLTLLLGFWVEERVPGTVAFAGRWLQPTPEPSKGTAFASAESS